MKSNARGARGLVAEGVALPRASSRASPTVFLAEDDTDLRLVLADVLADEGLRPVPFQTASSLLAALDDEVPDLIVTDLVMPGISGAQLLRAVRADERWRHIPVIVMTGTNDTALPLRLDAPIIYKPDTEALLHMIRTMLGPRPRGERAATG